MNSSMQSDRLHALPLGAIKPSGWLKDQLRIQADGLTGHLDEHWADVGPNSGWLGGTGESWERGPYYLDGLLPLAYLLEDERLLAKVKPWVEWTLSSQREDGSYGPTHLTTPNSEVARRDWWHLMLMLKSLTQYEEATGDERVIPFLTKFCRYLLKELPEFPLKEWASARGADLLLTVIWLYKRTKDAFLLELAELVRKQTIDWTRIFAKFPFWRKVETWDHRTHVVNVAMGIKTPGVLYQLSGNPEERDAVLKGIQSLMTYHGQAHGMFSGDEWLSGTHPSQGVELCAVVEYMFSMEQLIRIFGDGMYGDILEKVAFNALPAAISADWTSHQYDQQVNQVICHQAKRPWSNNHEANLFGLEPNFGCCTANMHQGWPKLVSHLWMGTPEGGLAAVSYAPCQVDTIVAGGVKAQLSVATSYPFREQVIVELSLSESCTFPVKFRVPGWCGGMTIAVNGVKQTFTAEEGFAKVEREWKSGDIVQIELPMEAVLEDRANEAVSVNRGPLVYVLPVEERWELLKKRERFHDWQVLPGSPWQFALSRSSSLEAVHAEMTDQPFEAGLAPVRLKARVKRVSNWPMEQHSAGAPPLNPIAVEEQWQEAELVPYGSARLRVGELPTLDEL